MRLLQLFAVQILIIVAPAHARDLYVDASNGDDSTSYGQNSAVTPWATLGRAAWGSTSRTNPNPAEAAQPGDTVIVGDGIYTASQMSGHRAIPAWNPANSGTAENNRIAFRSQNPGGAQLRSTFQIDPNNGQEWHDVADGHGGPLIGAFERNFITWDGFFIDEQFVQTRPDTGPVVVWDSDFITLENLEIVGTDKFWADNHNGIRLEDTDFVTLRGNRISGVRELSFGENANATGIMTYQSRDIVIEGNEIASNGSGMVIKGGNQGPFDVRSNIIHNNGTYGIYLIHVGLTFNGIPGVGASIYRNVLRDNGHAGIFVNPINNEPPPIIFNVDIVNNTLDGNTYGIFIRGEASVIQDFRFVNNIVSNSSFVAIEASELNGDLGFLTTMDYNLYHNNNGFAFALGTEFTLPQFQGLGFEANALAEAPLFTDEAAENFILQAGSPAIDAAFDILNLNNAGTSERIYIGANMNAASDIVIDLAPPPGPVDDSDATTGTNSNSSSTSTPGSGGQAGMDMLILFGVLFGLVRCRHNLVA